MAMKKLGLNPTETEIQVRTDKKCPIKVRPSNECGISFQFSGPHQRGGGGRPHLLPGEQRSGRRAGAKWGRNRARNSRESSSLSFLRPFSEQGALTSPGFIPFPPLSFPLPDLLSPFAESEKEEEEEERGGGD